MPQARPKSNSLIKLGIAIALGVALFAVLLWPESPAPPTTTVALATDVSKKQENGVVGEAVGTSLAQFRGVSLKDLVTLDPFQLEYAAVENEPESGVSEILNSAGETNPVASDPLAPTWTTAEIQELVANVIMETPDGRVALLGDRMVQVGSELPGGFVVTEITNSKVVILPRKTPNPLPNSLID